MCLYDISRATAGHSVQRLVVVNYSNSCISRRTLPSLAVLLLFWLLRALVSMNCGFHYAAGVIFSHVIPRYYRVAVDAAVEAAAAASFEGQY